MKKNVKRMICVILAVLLLTPAVFVGASAVSAPAFELRLSRSGNTVSAVFKLKSGNFDALDVRIDVSSNVTSCTYLRLSQQMKDIRDRYEDEGYPFTYAGNAGTRSFSIATPKAVEAEADVCEIGFTVNGKVTAADFNAVIVNCESFEKSQSYNVTNSAKVKTVDGELSFEEDSITINFKSQKKLEPVTNLSAGEIVWSSSNPKIVSVDEDGNITALKKGKATVTAQSADGSVSASVDVTVTYSGLQWFIIIVLFGWIWYLK